MLLCSICCLAFYLTYECTRPPLLNPHTYVKSLLLGKAKRIPCLVFIGDSITHQRVSGEFCRMVASDLGSSTTVVTCAQNSLASETVAQERVHHAIACRPDFVCVMIGTNDIRGVYNKEWGAKTRSTFGLEHQLSYERFAEHLTSIVATLLAHTAAQIALCTLPFMGEDLDNAANQCVAQANDCIKQTVVNICEQSPENQSRLVLLDTNQALTDVLLKTTTPEQRRKALKIDDFSSVAFSLAFRSKLLGQSYDHIGACFGLSLTCDALHLNDKGAMLVAGLVLKWIKGKREIRGLVPSSC